jgi:hypothetical protein
MTDHLELELRQLPGVRFVGFAEQGDITMVEIGLRPDGDPAHIRSEASALAAQHLVGGVRVEVLVQPVPQSVWPGDRQVPGDRDVQCDRPVPGEAAVSGDPAVPGDPPVPGDRDVPIDLEVRPADPAAPASPPGGVPESGPVRRGDVLDDGAGALADGGRVRLAVARPTWEGAAYELHLSYGERSAMAIGPADDLLEVAAATLDGIRRLGLATPFDAVAIQDLDDEMGSGTLVVLRDRNTGELRRGMAVAPLPEESTARAVLSALNRYLQPPPVRAGTADERAVSAPPVEG